MGKSDPCRLGLGHYQFRFLDRYRTRWHAHLGHPVFAPAKLAHVDQPLCGGDDAFCGDLRGDFPGIHVGRFWMAWYMAPIPNNWAIWPNFRSALMWDVFAVSTYFTVSVLFWYTGLIPGFGNSARSGNDKGQEVSFRNFCLGWRGANRNWRHYEMAYLLLAGLSTPLVLSVHSVVSFDFASTVIPTWHTTIFPPYFVAGAIFGGFGWC